MISHTYDNKPVAYFGLGRDEMLPFVSPSARTLLEVGCGKGAFVASLKARQAIHATGIEPYAAAAALARAHFDEIIELGVDEAVHQLRGRLFDCIVFNDVLEHMVDPWSVLRGVKQLLGPSGRLVASIPNIRYFPVLKPLVLDGSWQYQDYGVLDRTHLRFFTRSGILSLFDLAGYRVEAIQGINATTFSWKVKLLNRLMGGRLDDTRYQQFACVARAP
jgi:2-polyprenyl-3-methyl-5-hydroxy-6-metoxy-1,4-benzoquinol methylase